MRQDKRSDAGAELNDAQREAIRHIKREFGDGYFLVLLPGARLAGKPVPHIVISKQKFGEIAKNLRRMQRRRRR